MVLSALASSLQATLGAQLPDILGALGILIIGWLVAVTARAGMRRLLSVLKVNARIAIAVAFALSFGLGGREAAGRQMEHWLSKLRKGN